MTSTINFAAVTPKFDVLAEYKDYPMLPQKGDLLLIDGHPMKIVRWVHDNKEGNCGLAVMVVRDLEYDPYTYDEVVRRLEAGETFWGRGYKFLCRIVVREDGTHWLQSYDIQTGEGADRMTALAYKSGEKEYSDEHQFKVYVRSFLDSRRRFAVDDEQRTI